MLATLLASAARILWRVVERNPVDPALDFREAGLDPARMDDPEVPDVPALQGGRCAAPFRSSW